MYKRQVSGYFDAVFYLISDGLGLVFDGLSKIYHGFMSGDFFMILEGIFEILLGTFVTVILGGFLLLLGLGGTLLVFLYETFKSIIHGGREGLRTLQGVLITAGLVLAALVYFGVIAATWPVILGGVIITGLGLLLGDLYDTIVNAISDALPDFSPFSTGGIVNSNLQLVGERGPELVSLPRGSRVHSNANSRRMGGSGGNTINVHVNGRVGASDAEIRDIANKVAREINLRMSRTGSGVNNF